MDGFDDIYHYIGHIGMYQAFLYTMLALCGILFGIVSLAPNFFTYTPMHWCHVSRLDNYPHEWQRYVAVPYTDTGSDAYDSCHMFDLDYENISDYEIANWNRSLLDVDDIGLRECGAWTYDRTEFVSTIVIDVCRNTLFTFLLFLIVYMCTCTLHIFNTVAHCLQSC